MKFECDRKVLLEIVSTVGRVVPGITTRPILKCFLLDAEEKRLVVMATDTEVSIRKWSDSGVVIVSEPGKVVIRADRLLEVLSRTDSERVSFETVDSKLYVRCDKSEFKFVTEDATDYPSVREMHRINGVTMSLQADVLSQLFKQVLFACSRENTRYALSAVFVNFPVEHKGRVDFVSSDGKRLSLVRREGIEIDGVPLEKGYLLPFAFAKIVSGYGDMDEDVELKFSGDLFGVSVPGANMEIITSLIEGSFPTYEDVIPDDNDKVARIDRGLFLRKLGEAAVMADAKAQAVKLVFKKDGVMVLSSQSFDFGESKVEMGVEFEGDLITVGFNPVLLTQPLNVCGQENISFSLKDSDTAVLFDLGDGWRYVCMPLTMG